jgi:hypothetical protein
MKVVSYSSVVPAKNKNDEKEHLLRKFLVGVEKLDDSAYYHQGFDLVDCDVAVIQGWQHRRGKTAPHLKLRENIINHQTKNGKYVCVADSNLFLYATDKNQPHHYLRYSFNGVFPSTGIYCDNQVDSRRWQQISKDLNIRLENKKQDGKNILICLQRHGGWSMGSIDINSWINMVISSIRQYSDRTIVLRPHPKDNNANQYLKNVKKDSKVKISQNQSLDLDLAKAWCVVNHNSSSIVGAIIKGYPAFITDPNNSQCAEVSYSSFSKIESPEEFDREKWLQRISMFHWKFTELEDGTAWRHMRNYVRQ